MATFGFFKNKSKSEVYSKEEADEQFAAKTDLDRYARKNHASTSQDYGIGSESSYGHCKVSDNGIGNGVAFSGKAGQQLKDRIERDETAIQQNALNIANMSNRVYVAVNNIVVSGYPDVGDFTRAMKYGTWEYVGKVKGEKLEDGSWVDVIIGYAYKRLT